MAPVEQVLSPPTRPVFSRMITSWPWVTSRSAAVVPEPPAPTTTVSQVNSSSGAGSCSLAMLKATMLPPACSNAWATPESTAWLVMVAPVITSTAMD